MEKEKEEKTAYFIGVVLDATRPFKKESKYMTKVKIIDPTLNWKTEIADEKKFLQVYIETPKKEDAPVIKSIGDILVLHRFKVKLE